MLHEKNLSNRIFDVLLIVLCVLIGLITLYPIWYVICCSLSSPSEVLRGQITIWPIDFSTESYGVVFGDTSLWNAVKMSVLYTCFATVGMLITCTLMAFPLTRRNLKFRRAIVIFLVIPMYFSGGLVPTFIAMTKMLNLYNTVWAVMLPSLISIFNIILCRTYMAGIPLELQEAAFIDGAGNWQVLLKVIMPLCKPVFGVIAIYTIVGNWNGWWNSMLYQTKTALHPLQMYLQRLIVQQSVDLTELIQAGVDADEIATMAQKALLARQLKFTFIVVTTVPILFVYPFFQKYFVKGVMLGSLKG